MKKSYVKYYINKKGTDKYLHTVDSGYGRKTSLTEGILFGDWYTTASEAYIALDSYVAKTKTADYSMFMIQKVEISYETVEEKPVLDDIKECFLTLSAYGIVGEEASKKIDEAWIKDKLMKQYKVEPESFDFEIVEDFVDSEGHTYYRCEVSNIIWNC